MEGRGLVSLFCMWFSQLKRLFFPHWSFLAPLSNISRPYRWGLLLYFLSCMFPMPAPVSGLSDLLGFKSYQVLAGSPGHGAACDYNLALSLHFLPGIMPDAFHNLLSFSFLKYSTRRFSLDFSGQRRSPRIETGKRHENEMLNQAVFRICSIQNKGRIPLGSLTNHWPMPRRENSL